MKEILMNQLAKKLFWYVSLPSMLVISVFCLYKGENPLDNFFSAIPLLSALPLIMRKMDAMDEKAIREQQEEFSKMGATEFLNYLTEFRKIPLGKFRARYKEAYRREYLVRYEKDIFHDIPMFGE